MEEKKLGKAGIELGFSCLQVTAEATKQTINPPWLDEALGMVGEKMTKTLWTLHRMTYSFYIQQKCAIYHFWLHLTPLSTYAQSPIMVTILSVGILSFDVLSVDVLLVDIDIDSHSLHLIIHQPKERAWAEGGHRINSSKLSMFLGMGSNQSISLSNLFSWLKASKESDKPRRHSWVINTSSKIMLNCWPWNWHN